MVLDTVNWCRISFPPDHCSDASCDLAKGAGAKIPARLIQRTLEEQRSHIEPAGINIAKLLAFKVFQQIFRRPRQRNFAELISIWRVLGFENCVTSIRE